MIVPLKMKKIDPTYLLYFFGTIILQLTLFRTNVPNKSSSNF